MTRVVIVRPWRHGAAAGGCCSADPGSVRAPAPGDRVRHDASHDAAHDDVAAVYQLIRAELPAADVQVVNAGNTAYLLPATYRSARARLGRVAALRAAVRATTAGAVLVDGEPVGHLETAGAEALLTAISARAGVQSTLRPALAAQTPPASRRPTASRHR